MGYVLDPELAAWGPMVPKMDLNDVAATREAERQVLSQMPPYEAGRRLAVTDAVVPGPPGGPDVRVRVYVPAQRPKAVPGVLYFHGGAHAFGSLATVDNPARMIADHVNIAVVNVEFRLAPEHPYPASLDDSYAVLEWLAGTAAGEYGIDPDRLAVLGESSGGGLAAALALLSRDRGGPRLAAQFLDAPTVDDRLDTPSMRTISDAITWQAVNSPVLWRYYLANTAKPGSGEVPLYAAPAHAEVTDLAGLPPAWVAVYEIDPTRDEGLSYARQLIQAGVPTELHHYSGACHIAHILPGTAIGARITSDRLDAIRRILRTGQ
jgi:acetyl esterase